MIEPLASEDESSRPGAAAPDELEIRRELGLGGGAVSDAEEVEALHGALEGSGAGAGRIEGNLELLRDVHLPVRVELGRGRMPLGDLLRLGQGSVVELESLAGDPLDISVGDQVIARGEVLVLDENYCIRITQVFRPDELRSGT